jgi:hypothetical protein
MGIVYTERRMTYKGVVETRIRRQQKSLGLLYYITSMLLYLHKDVRGGRVGGLVMLRNVGEKPLT